jgi:NAD(P)-dependent dehydrogenase (short-subunit alcohol dehydrogenase family)
VVLVSEYILNNNTGARIVIIGSESGKKGSFDTVYFLSKCALRGYVRERKVGENQQIVLISPSTIEDSRMTQNRKDLDRLNSYKSSHPKKRFLYMEEIAKLLASLLLEQTSYITNCEIEINGGKFARMS